MKPGDVVEAIFSPRRRYLVLKVEKVAVPKPFDSGQATIMLLTAVDDGEDVGSVSKFGVSWFRLADEACRVNT